MAGPRTTTIDRHLVIASWGREGNSNQEVEPPVHNCLDAVVRLTAASK